MTKLEIFLFGPPHVEIDYEWVNFKTHKAIGIIAYLSLTKERHSREVISSLFWPKSNQSSASASLRTTLWRMKNAGLHNWLLIDRNSIEIDRSKDVNIDVNNFQELLIRSNHHGHPSTTICDECISMLEKCINMYHNGFMQGYFINGSREYEEWQYFHEQRLRFEFASVAGRLVRAYRNLSNLEKALEYANYWITNDPYNDEAHKLLMELFADSGQRESALKQYHHYVHILKQDLNISPDESTTELFTQIKNGVRNTLITRNSQYNALLFYIDFTSINLTLEGVNDSGFELINSYKQYLSNAIQAFGGRVLNIQHHSCLALFENGKPIECALTLQSQSNTDQQKMSAGRLPKIVISTIEKNNLLDVFNSPEYLRVKQLDQTAWEGQVLISPQVLSNTELPEQVELIDFGLHTLKDLGEPVQIFGLKHPQLRNAKKPPRSMKGHPHNLPPQSTPFIGREYETSLISSWLDNPMYHLIALIGPGGIGKTRLALQVAANQIEKFPDGVFYFSLNSLTKPELFYPELGNILNYRFSSQDNPEEQINNFLRGKQVLLILDNFENLLQGPSVLIDLLQNIPSSKIIVTSRERLNLSMEWIQEIKGLPYPGEDEERKLDQYAACQLFIQSAKRVYPDFVPDYDQIKCIARICRTVEGSPLAIELAASWVRSLPCCEIADQIKNNLDFLIATMQDLPPRHRSLRAVFDSSWGLLSEEERRVLRKLSIFRGSFRRDAAEKIANASHITLRNCADKSMLKYYPDGRYEMQESVRYFAEEKLNSTPNEKGSLILDFCNYYGKWLEGSEINLIGHRQLDALKELREEIKNIYYAWLLALNKRNYQVLEESINTLFLFHEILCLYRDGCEYYQNALEIIEQDTNSRSLVLKAQIRSRLGWFNMRLGHQAEGIKLMHESLIEVRKNAPLREYLFLLIHLGEAYRLVGDYGLSIEYISECNHILNSDHSIADHHLTFMRAQAMLHLGTLHYSFGRFKEARETLEMSLAIFEKIGGSWWIARTINSLGVVISKMKDYEEAIKLRQKSLELFREIGDKRGTAITMNNLASNLFSLGRTEDVIEIATESLRISKEIGDRRFASIVMQNLAQDYLVLRGDFSKAEKYYLESIEVFREINDERGTVYALKNYALALLDKGEIESAREHCDEALALAINLWDVTILLHVLSGIARLYYAVCEYKISAELCGYLLAQPGIDDEIMQKLNQLVKNLISQIPERTISNFMNKGKTMQLEEIVDLVQDYSPSSPVEIGRE